MLNIPFRLSDAIRAFEETHKGQHYCMQNRIDNRSPVPKKGVVRFKTHRSALFEFGQQYRGFLNDDFVAVGNAFPDDDKYMGDVFEVILNGDILYYRGWTRWARYISTSSTILCFQCRAGSYGDDGYILFAASLYKNISIVIINFNEKRPSKRLNIAFTNAIRLNPRPSDWMSWALKNNPNWFPMLQSAAEKSTSPSMLEFLLCVDHEDEKLQTKIH